MKNDLIRARRWYILMTSVLFVVFAVYYAATGEVIPRWEYFFRNEPWALKHLMSNDLPRFWAVLVAPLFIVCGTLLVRIRHWGGGFWEAGTLGGGAISASTGVVMLPFGVATSLVFLLSTTGVLSVVLIVSVILRFAFNKATWRRLGDWLQAKDVEEAQKNGDNQPTAVIESRETVIGQSSW